MGGTVDFLWKGYYQSVFLNTIFSFKKSDFQAFPVGGILGKQNDLAWFYCMVIQKSPCLCVFLCIYSNRSTEIDFSFAVVCNTFLRMWVRSCLQMAGNLCGNASKIRLGLPFFL